MAGNPKFHEILREMADLYDRKNADYGQDKDPLSNFRGAEEFGVPAWVGAMIRASDKVARVQSFAKKGELQNEGVEDSLIDLANYAVLALVLFREQVGAGEARGRTRAPADVPPAQPDDEWPKVDDVAWDRHCGGAVKVVALRGNDALVEDLVMHRRYYALTAHLGSGAESPRFERGELVRHRLNRRKGKVVCDFGSSVVVEGPTPGALSVVDTSYLEPLGYAGPYSTETPAGAVEPWEDLDEEGEGGVDPVLKATVRRLAGELSRGQASPEDVIDAVLQA